MHKGVILLTKASDTDEAKSKAEEFLEPYGNDVVWDWYSIGGRWSGVLNTETEKFYDLVKERGIFKDENFISTKDVEENREVLQAIWEELGKTSENPYSRDSYKNGDNEEGEDIVLAIEAESILKKWEKDMEKEAEEFWNKAVEERKIEDERAKKEKEYKPSYGMSGYYAGLYKDCRNDYFSFESSIYDVDEETNKLPSDLTGYFAIMVDMHS